MGPRPYKGVLGATAGRGPVQAFMGHRSIANTVIYTAVADKRLRHIWDR